MDKCSFHGIDLSSVAKTSMEQHMQLLFQYCKRVVLLRQPVIMFGHFLDKFAILQGFSNMLNSLFGDETIELNSPESFWFDIY